MWVIKRTPMQDEYLTRVVIDPSARNFYLYSNEGDEKVVDCDTYDEFMAVFQLITDRIDEEQIFYTKPLVAA